MTKQRITAIIGSVLTGLFSILFITPIVWAAIYYVDATGGNDANNGFSEAAPWKTVAKVNSSSFAEGDSIMFKKGETWREQLNVTSSGSAENPITFGAYGTGTNPVINGADLIFTWRESDEAKPNVWEADLATEPYQVFFNGAKGTRVLAISSCSEENNWYWGDNILYCYSTADPDTIYTAPGIEASKRQYCIYVSGKNYIVVDGIDSEKAGAFQIPSYNVYLQGSDFCIIKNFNTTNGYHSGICLRGGSSNCLVHNVVATYNGEAKGVGIGIWNPDADNNEISDCICRNNYFSGITNHGLETSSDGPNGSWIHNNQSYNNGGKGISVTMSMNTVVERNTIYHNGTADARFGDGVRIGAGDYDTPWGTGNICRYNIVYSNRCNGLTLYREINPQVYYNIFYDNGKSDSTSGACSIEVTDFDGGLICNNIMYNSYKYGLLLQNGVGANIILKNNIIHTSRARTAGIYVYDNANSYFKSDYNVVYNIMNFGQIRTGGAYSLANWKSITGQDVHSFNSDPKFFSLPNSDFHLQATSPCINSGVNIGLTVDYNGITVPQGPGVDIGVYEWSLLSLSPPKNFRISSVPM